MALARSDMVLRMSLWMLAIWRTQRTAEAELKGFNLDGHDDGIARSRACSKERLDVCGCLLRPFWWSRGDGIAQRIWGVFNVRAPKGTLGVVISCDNKVFVRIRARRIYQRRRTVEEMGERRKVVAMRRPVG